MLLSGQTAAPHQWLRDTRGEFPMQELDGIDLPDGRRGTVVYVRANALLIIVEVVQGLLTMGSRKTG